MARWTKSGFPHYLKDHIDVTKNDPVNGQTILWKDRSYIHDFPQNLKPVQLGPDANGVINIDWTNTQYVIIDYNDRYTITFTNPPPTSTKLYIRLYNSSNNVAPIVYFSNSNILFSDTKLPTPPSKNFDTVLTIIYDKNSDTYHLTFREKYTKKGWLYRYKVTVTNKYNFDLQNVNVPIAITDADIFLISKDGSDIRVTDINGTFLNHFVEFWNIDKNNTGTIWVNIPSIPALTTLDFYIYVGNPFATTSYSSPRIFTFYDSCESLSGWIRYGYGILTLDYRTFNYFTIKKDIYGDPNGGYKILPTALSTFYMVIRTHRNSITNGNYNRYGIVDSLGNGIGPLYGYNTGFTSFGYDIRRNWRGTATELGQVSDLLYTWSHLATAYDGNNLTISALTDDYQLLGSGSATVGTFTNLNRVYIFGGFPYYTSRIMIMNYESSLASISNVVREALNPQYDNPDWY